MIQIIQPATIIKRVEFAGTALSGSDGTTNRTYTISSGNAIKVISVFQSKQELNQSADVTINNSTKIITFLKAAFNDEVFSIIYKIGEVTQ